MSGIVLLVLRGGMTIALYAFLGWALWLLWQDLRNQPTNFGVQHIAPFRIKIVVGDNSRIQSVSSAEFIIGRDPNCDCVIDSKTVSTQHARLSFDRGQWWVEDLASTNGTLLNQATVSAPTVVTPGDQLRCGEAILLVERPPSEGQHEQSIFGQTRNEDN